MHPHLCEELDYLSVPQWLTVQTAVRRGTVWRPRLLLLVMILHAKYGGYLFRRMVSSGMLRRVVLVNTDVSEELRSSFIRVTIVCELGTTLAVTSNRGCAEWRVKMEAQGSGMLLSEGHTYYTKWMSKLLGDGGLFCATVTVSVSEQHQEIQNFNEKDLVWGRDASAILNNVQVDFRLR
jgi:hypothetical protein